MRLPPGMRATKQTGKIANNLTAGTRGDKSVQPCCNGADTLRRQCRDGKSGTLSPLFSPANLRQR